MGFRGSVEALNVTSIGGTAKLGILTDSRDAGEATDNNYIWVGDGATFGLGDIPSEFANLPVIHPNIDLRQSTSTGDVTFTINVACQIVVWHVDEITTPSWLTSTFTNTGHTIELDGQTASGWAKGFGPGAVSLDGNAGSANDGMYIVSVVPGYKTVNAAGSAGTISFDSTTSSINENAGSALTIYATRSGGTEGAASCDVDDDGGGTATAGTDYNAIASTTLSWAAGEGGQKSVALTPTDRAGDQGNRTVILLMDNFSGASAGAITTHTTTIVETDASPTPADRFVDLDSGSDSDDGTSGNAWRTIAKANSTLVAGETVQITFSGSTKTITASSEAINPAVSGTSGNEIKYTVASDKTLTFDLSGYCISPSASYLQIGDNDSGAIVFGATSRWDAVNGGNDFKADKSLYIANTSVTNLRFENCTFHGGKNWQANRNNGSLIAFDNCTFKLAGTNNALNGGNNTVLNNNESSGSTVLEVSDTGGLSVGETITVELDNGKPQNTIVQSKVTNTSLTVSPSLNSAASSGNIVAEAADRSDLMDDKGVRCIYNNCTFSLGGHTNFASWGNWHVIKNSTFKGDWTLDFGFGANATDGAASVVATGVRCASFEAGSRDGRPQNGVNSTTLDGAEAAGQTTLSVAATPSAVGAHISIELDTLDGRTSYHTSRITSKSSGVSYTIADGLPSAAASGNKVQEVGHGPILIEGCTFTDAGTTGDGSGAGMKMLGFHQIFRGNWLFDGEKEVWRRSVANSTVSDHGSIRYLEAYNNTCYAMGYVVSNNYSGWGSENQFWNERFTNNIFAEMDSPSTDSTSNACYILRKINNSGSDGFSDWWKGAVWENNYFSLNGGDVSSDIDLHIGSVIKEMGEANAEWPNSWLASNAKVAPTFTSVGSAGSRSTSGFAISSGTGLTDGVKMANTTNSGSSSTSLQLDNGRWLFDGWGMSSYFSDLVAPDYIKIVGNGLDAASNGNIVQIQADSIVWAADGTGCTVTLQAAKSWASGDDVYFVASNGSTLWDNVGANQ